MINYHYNNLCAIQGQYDTNYGNEQDVNQILNNQFSSANVIQIYKIEIFYMNHTTVNRTKEYENEIIYLNKDLKSWW